MVRRTVMNELISQFAVKGAPAQYSRYGCGHINETYMVTCDSGFVYILQKINKSIFTKPEELMENIAATTAFLAERSDDPRASMHLVLTTDGKTFYKDAEGEYWRMYDFVPSTVCMQKAETPKDFYFSGLAFGRFQGQLADFPAQTLHEAIVDFHNTRVRFAQLHAAIEKNYENRAELCKVELEFALARECEAGAIVDKLANGELPLRVTHNDTKLNNVLFDYDTRTPLCVIDLDTIMPGSSLYDYGDSIRFGASTAAEDEKDLDKVWCDMELFRTYTEGFLEGCNGSLTDLEVEMLPMGAKMMTLECGIRFLADYLNGDTYFRTHYEGQNLDRARTQFKLVADMESKWEMMHTIVKESVK
ncbi:MAG: aminoglycoside phosphotransferase family protein [Oscillospiraceae bacterium]|nr:aminoglycoside phosphotransferase family protein [Oscillospiraceae bacterium]